MTQHRQKLEKERIGPIHRECSRENTTVHTIITIDLTANGSVSNQLSCRLNMFTRRRFSVFVLLAHMVLLSVGNIEKSFEKVHPGGFSTVSIQDESSEVAKRVSKNVASKAGVDNFYTIPRATSVSSGETTSMEKENKFEDDLEEALENVVASGQTLIVISAAQAENSTKQIFSPLIVIEGPSTSTPTVESAEAEPTIRRDTIDQDISPSQSRTRLTSGNSADGEPVDNIEHILAVAEYEPQKLGAADIENDASIDIRRDGTNHLERSGGHRISEEPRYGVDGQGTFPRKLQRGKEYATKTTPTSRSTLAFADSTIVRKDRTRLRPESLDYNYKSSKREASSPPTFREKSSDAPGVDKRPREPGHSELSASSTSESDPSLAPHDHHFDNFTDDLESPPKRYHKSPIGVSHASLPGAEFRVADQNGVSLDREKAHYPAVTAETLKLARSAEKRVDHYSTPGYNAKSSEDQSPLRVPNNVQLGFLTRYNLPSLILPRTSMLHPRSLEAATHARPIVAPENSREIGDESVYIAKNNGRKPPRSDESTYDYYQDSEEQIRVQSPSTGGPSTVRHFGEKFPIDEAIPTLHDSRGDHKAQTKTSNSYEKTAKSIPTFVPIDETYQDYGLMDKPKSMDHSPRSAMEQRQSLATAGYPRVVPPGPIYRPDVHPTEPPTIRRRWSNGPIDPRAFNLLNQTAVSPGITYTDGKLRQPMLQSLSRQLGKPEPSLSVRNEKRVDGSSSDVGYDHLARPRRIQAREKHNDPASIPFAQVHSTSSSPIPQLATSRRTSDPAAGVSISHHGPSTDGPKNRRIGEEKGPKAETTIDRSEKRRIGSAESNEEPAESVRQADVVENTGEHEDEEVASLEDQAPRHENYEVHEESKKDPAKDEESETGGGEKHAEGHRTSGGEKGEKAYKEWHEYDKGKKGHHDSEKHEKEYDVSKGDEKKHDDSGGYHEEHDHGEKANKESEFDEEGEYQKGHSTKGQHVVHKNDEYEKKTEFYDESHEEDDGEKEGEYRYEHENEEGGLEKIGHHDSGYHVDKYGEKGEREKGRHWKENEGHENKDGRELEHEHQEKFGKKGAHEEGEEWSRQNGKKQTR